MSLQSTMQSGQSAPFPTILKHWRGQKKLSQLDLALLADVSQRHVSWLETGRSQPSRDMVLRLSEAMEIPLRDRNQILNAAGFASMFTEHTLSAPSMQPVMQALQHMLENHEPYPAIVLDRLWNIRLKNQAADILFEIAGDPQALWDAVGDNGERNIALLCVHPNGLRNYISNWANAGPPFMQRLRSEALASGDAAVLEKFSELEAIAGDDFGEEMGNAIGNHSGETHLLPILPLEFKLGDFELSLFSVISTFGTPQDITTDELRIETFYPSDEQTAKFFRE